MSNSMSMPIHDPRALAFLDEAAQANLSIEQGYCCISTHTENGRGVSTGQARLWFHRPNLLRLERWVELEGQDKIHAGYICDGTTLFLDETGFENGYSPTHMPVETGNPRWAYQVVARRKAPGASLLLGYDNLAIYPPRDEGTPSLVSAFLPEADFEGQVCTRVQTWVGYEEVGMEIGPGVVGRVDWFDKAFGRLLFTHSMSTARSYTSITQTRYQYWLGAEFIRPDCFDVPPPKS